MTEQKETRGFSNFGFSTILLSFVMICVVTFSALSLVTAYSDYKLSKKVADNTSEYYEAEGRAYEKLMLIDNALVQSYRAAADEGSYYSNVEKNMGSYGVFAHTAAEYYLSFEEEISEGHTLSVKLSFPYPTKDTDTFYEIVEWKSVYKREAPEDEILNLIQ